MSHCIKRKRTSGKEASELCLSSIAVPVPEELTVRVKMIREKFEEITKDWRDLNLKPSDGKKRPNRYKVKRHLTTSLVDASTIHGRGNEKEEIVQLLLPRDANGSDNGISVLVITGLGGVGKTTVAQLVCNDPRVGQFFDLMAWVCVPMNFDVEKLTRSILTSFTKKKWDPIGLDNLQRRLMEEVKGKRFLLVLDDVWSDREDPWSKLRLPLNYARSGVVLVTTRNNTVAKLMGTMPSYPLSILPFDNCWSLFKQIVFEHQDLEKYANLLEIGEKIVRKCGGSPLAIKALGNALRIANGEDEPDEEVWLDVLNSELWEITEGEMEVLPALKLSYDQMPSDLKQCFLIFSLFPKDFTFIRENIVKLWISLGYIQLDGKKLAEDVGGSYFDNLVQRSMIQKNYYNQRVDGFFMHDLIHDLAQFMAGKDFSRKEFEKLEDLPFEVRFLSIVVNNLPERINLDLLCQPRKLRILQIVSAMKKFNNDISIEMPDKLFKNLKHLRALDFSHTNIQSLPDSIGNLKQLRYLNLMKTNIRKLPESICLLYYLQTLELRECPLQELPAGISCLLNLRHLNFLQKDVCIRHGIGKLRNLITLPMFHIGWGDLHCHIAELKDLVNLHGELHILGLHNVMSIESVKEAHLPTKRHLEILKLDWSGGACHIHHRQGMDTINAKNLEEKVLQGLQPHNRLKELYVNGYPGLKFPSWLGNVSFSKMTKITISSCGRCNELPTLGSLLYLKFLSIEWMWNIHRVGREFCCRDPETKGFRFLETLEFMCMPKWLEWSGVVNDEFCSLQSVRISDCRELRCLPQPFSTSLIKMVIKNCKELRAVPLLPSLSSLILTGDLSEELFFNLQLPSLKFLKIMSSKNIRSFSLNYESLTSLQVLVIKGCKNLQMVVGISNISSLRQLSIVRCYLLRLSSSEGIPPSLQVLTITNCPALREWEKEQTATFFSQV